MPITTEQMQQIIVDTVTGKEQRVVGPDTDKFREELAVDLKLAEERGWQVEVPAEW